MIEDCNNFQPRVNQKKNEVILQNKNRVLSPAQPILQYNKFNCGQGEENISDGSNEFEDNPKRRKGKKEEKIDRFTQLYMEAEKRQKEHDDAIKRHKQQYATICTFQPKIGRSPLKAKSLCRSVNH